MKIYKYKYEPSLSSPNDLKLVHNNNKLRSSSMILQLIHIHNISKILLLDIFDCNFILNIALYHLIIHLIESVELFTILINLLQVYH